MKKRCLSVVLVLVIFFSYTCYTYAAILPMTLYEERDGNYIAKGIYYEDITRYTEKGWMDIDVVTADLKDSAVDMQLLQPDRAGDKEPLSVLVKNKNELDDNIVAGINGDFFATNKILAVALGAMIEDGQIENAYDVDHNIENGQFMLLEDKQGSVIFDALKIHFGLTNNAGDWMEITAVNKMTSVYKPTYFDSTAIKDTSELDKLNQWLYKIVVRDNMITEIVTNGGTVQVPEDGYIITMNSIYAEENLKKFKVGQRVSFNMESNINIEDIKLGMAGGGQILRNGDIVEKPGLMVAPNGRQPRTAVGVSKDGSKLIMLTVDGRGHSIGTTMKETAELMKEFGAYNALMFDGGGSTTMVARPSGEEDTKIVNKPSDAFERPVINGLGIASSAKETSEMGGLHLKASAKRAFINNSVELTLTGYDSNYNPVTIDNSEVKWETIGVSGFWSGTTFYPTSTGKAFITATYKGVSEMVEVIVMEPAMLRADPQTIHVGIGESKTLKVYGVDSLGFSAPIDASSLRWSVDEKLGSISDGVFKANNTVGAGQIIGKLGDATVNIFVSIGEDKMVIENFNSKKYDIESVVYPEVVEASVSYVSGQEGKGVALNYSFIGDTEATQGAYVQFKEPIAIKGSPTKIGLQVKGDGSGKWLRGKIVDANGESHTITFTYDMNWSDWNYAEAKLPDNVAYPVSLERVYVVSLGQEQALKSEITIDSLTASYPINKDIKIGTEELKDNKYLSYEEFIGQEGSKVGVFGSTAGKNTLLDHIIQREAIKQINESTDAAIFAGPTDVDHNDMQVPYFKWEDAYSVIDYGEMRVFQLATSKGGLRFTDPNQWIHLQKELRETGVENIVITMNADPLTGFKDKSEGKLLHQILSDFVSETGKNVFVINASGYETSHKLYEGIRYIDLNGLWYNAKNEKLDLQNTFYMLLFNIRNGELTYTIKSIYE